MNTLVAKITQWICGRRKAGHRWAEFPREFWRAVEPIVDDPIEQLFDPCMKQYFQDAGILLCARCGAVAKRYKTSYRIVSPGTFYSNHFTTRDAYVVAHRVLREQGEWSSRALRQ